MSIEFAFLVLRFVEVGCNPTPHPPGGPQGKSQAHGKYIHSKAVLLSYTTLK